MSAFDGYREPSVDHYAFVTKDLAGCESMLLRAGVTYRRFGGPATLTGITQLFLFDPDGNVVELSDCAPPVGLKRCLADSMWSGEEPGSPPEMGAPQRSRSETRITKLLL